MVDRFKDLQHQTYSLKGSKPPCGGACLQRVYLRVRELVVKATGHAKQLAGWATNIVRRLFRFRRRREDVGRPLYQDWFEQHGKTNITFPIRSDCRKYVEDNGVGICSEASCFSGLIAECFFLEQCMLVEHYESIQNQHGDGGCTHEDGTIVDEPGTSSHPRP